MQHHSWDQAAGDAARLAVAIVGDISGLEGAVDAADKVVQQAAERMSKQGGIAGSDFGEQFGDNSLMGQVGQRMADVFGQGFSGQLQRVLPGVMKHVVSGAALLAVAEIGRVVGRQAVELTGLGAELEAVANSYEILADAPGPWMEAMREASRNTVSDMELMRSANRAMLMGVVEDQSQLEDLLRVSHAMARARGMDVTDYFTRMTNALASLHPTTLRSLGIMIDTSTVYGELAESIGKSVSALDDQEKRQAIVAAILEQELVQSLIAAQDEGDNLADQLGRTGTAQDNFRQSLGRLVGEAVGASGALDTIAAGFDFLAGSIDRIDLEKLGRVVQAIRIGGVMGGVAETGRMVGTAMAEEFVETAGLMTGEQFNEMLQEQANLLVGTSESWEDYRQAIDDLLVPGKEYEDWMDRLDWATYLEMFALATTEVIMNEEAFQRAMATWGGVPQVMDSVAVSMDGASDSARALARVMQELGAVEIPNLRRIGEDISGLVEAQLGTEEMLERRQRQLGSMTPLSEEWFSTMQDINKLQSTIAKEGRADMEAYHDVYVKFNRSRMDDIQLLRDLQREQEGYTQSSVEWFELQMEIDSVESRIEREREAAANRATQRANQRMREIEAQRRAMEGLIRQQIQLTQVTHEDMLRTQLGVYEDKPDEYIRRLRSAVHDEESLWKDLLQGRSGAEAELYLLEQERAFRMGAWHELGPGFDRAEAIERIVENVNRELEAQRQMQALVEEIMMHPGLVGVDRQQIERTLGLPEDYTRTGLDNARAFAEGLDMAVPEAVAQLHESFEEEFREEKERWVLMGELSIRWFTEGIEQGAHDKAVETLVNMIAPRVADMLRGRP